MNAYSEEATTKAEGGALSHGHTQLLSDKERARLSGTRGQTLTAQDNTLGVPSSGQDAHTTGIFSEPTFPQPRILSRGALSAAESKRQQKSHTIHASEYGTNVFRPGTSAGAGTKKMEIKDVSYPAPDHYRAKSMARGGSLYTNS